MLIFFIELGPGPRWAQTYPFKDTISLSLERLQFLKQLCIVHNFKPCFFKKRMDCAWDSNPGPRDGRRRQNHGAMAATLILNLV